MEQSQDEWEEKLEEPLPMYPNLPAEKSKLHREAYDW